MFNKKLGKREIKEGLDNLPTGIVFAKENGVILLANKIMYDLYFELTGKVLQNIHSFIDSLNTKIEGIKNSEDTKMPTLIFNDHEVYSFSLKKVCLNNTTYLQLTASNITELYKLQTEITKKNNDLLLTRNKILETKKTLKDVTRENEIISAKIKVHDTMGTNLATIKHYLNTGTGDIKKALSMWDDSFNILKNSDHLKENNEFDSFIKGASDMGIKVTLNGRLPSEKRLIKTIINISKECLINAVLHAKASEIFLEVINADKEYLIKISNNGKNPKKEIKPGGGFMAIENYLDEVGGRFKVKTEPTFCLTLTLAKHISNGDY